MNRSIPYHQLDGHTLLKMLRHSDQKAFSEIYDRYWNKLLAIAYHHSHSRETAEEMVQEVFLSLWKRRADVTIGVLENYLATAVKFAVFDYRLKEKRRKDLLIGNYVSETFHDIENSVQAKFLEDYIRGIVECLPEKCKLVFHYSREQGLGNEEIADRLGISVKTVEGHITRALKTIKNSLGSSYLPAAGILTLREILILIKKV